MAEKEKNNELENMSFEDAINELEKIINKEIDFTILDAASFSPK